MSAPTNPSVTETGCRGATMLKAISTKYRELKNLVVNGTEAMSPTFGSTGSYIK